MLLLIYYKRLKKVFWCRILTRSAGILSFYGILAFFQKAKCTTKIRLFRLFPPFHLFHWIRLLDFPALVQMGLKGPKEGTLLIGSNDCLPWQILSGHQASSPGLLIDRFQKKSQGPEWHFKQGVKINVPQSLIFETFFGKQSPKYKSCFTGFVWSERL